MKLTHLGVMAILLAPGCKRERGAQPRKDVAREETRADKPITAGPILDAKVVHGLFLYFQPEPAADPEAAYKGCARPDTPPRVDELPDAPDQAVMTMAREKKADFPPPPADFLEYTSHGLSPAEMKALQKTGDPVALGFAAPRPQALSGLKAFTLLAACMADRTRAILFDASSVETLSAKAFRERRLAEWTAEWPPLSGQFAIHAYRTGEYARAVSVGLAKFGLPDLVVNEFAPSRQEIMASLINLTADTLAKQGKLTEAGRVTLELEARRATFSLVEADHEEGDPENRLYEIRFDGFPGKGPREQQSAGLEQLFGSVPDPISYESHDDPELMARSRQAKAQLERLRQRFEKGLAPGEHLSVKAPFATSDGGNEWMWVEVVAWKGDRIHGVLANEPQLAKGVRLGSEVTVDSDDVFDYLYKKQDGTTEGNETGKLMEARQGKPAP